jgi:heme oxygenase
MTDVATDIASPAARLRRDTTAIHRLTEHEPFISRLMGGASGVRDFARMTAQFRSVYEALEGEVAAARGVVPEAVATLFDPRLERVPALDHDLRALGIDGDPAALEALPATSAYVERIRTASASWPRLLAHHYVRYLGDLSGGQVVAAMMRRHYGVPDDALTFYAFDALPSKGGLKTTYRALLDEALADDAAYAATLDEALAAYEANRALFSALGGAEA